jgi:hypothetical protein
MDRLVLTADLSDPAAAWRRVVFIPFGNGASSLGFHSFPEGPSSQPSALAIAPDGTIWIDDRWKRRLAHYSPAGEFLGAIGGLTDRGYDLTFSHGQLYVLAYPGGFRRGGSVAFPGRVRGFDVTPVIEGGRGVLIDRLFPSSVGVATLANGYWDSRVPGREGPRDFVQLDIPGSGETRSIPGLPLTDESWFKPQALATGGGGDQDFDFSFLSASTTEVQPVHIIVRVQDDDKEKSILAEVGIVDIVPVGQDVVMYLMLAPTLRKDAVRYGGGRWLLRIGRSPVLWERLPDPGIADELERRHIAAGADGSLYLMMAQKEGIEIFRRP